MKLDHVQVVGPPGCEEEARAFYGTLLGLREIPKAGETAATGGVWFALSDGGELHVGVLEGFVPARKAHPGLAVSDAELDGFASRLAEAGHEVTWDEKIPGVRRFYVSDPFGNRVELRSGPD